MYNFLNMCNLDKWEVERTYVTMYMIVLFNINNSKRNCMYIHVHYLHIIVYTLIVDLWPNFEIYEC